MFLNKRKKIHPLVAFHYFTVTTPQKQVFIPLCEAETRLYVEGPTSTSVSKLNLKTAAVHRGLLLMLSEEQ